MKNKIVILFVSIICFMTTINSSAFANETYYYKGAKYTGTYTDFQGTKTSNSSVFVISASTSFANPMGKERIRGYTRCDTINGIYKSSYCGINEINLKMSAASSTGGDLNILSLVKTLEVLPKQSTPINLTDYTWFINNVLFQGAVRIVNAIANDANTNVVHYPNASDFNMRVKFVAPDKSLVDVPNTVTYDNIEGYYSSYAKGVSTLMPFQYNTGGGIRYLNVTGSAIYDLRIQNDPLQPPMAITVTTGSAKLTHSIGG